MASLQSHEAGGAYCTGPAVTYMFNSVVSARLQVSFLFPGVAAQQIAGAMTDQGTEETVNMGGVDFERALRADARTIHRLGAELLWSF